MTILATNKRKSVEIQIFAPTCQLSDFIRKFCGDCKYAFLVLITDVSMFYKIRYQQASGSGIC